jgi:hypothetical protein
MGSTNVDAPAPRNAYQEGAGTLQAQIDLAPQQLEVYRNTTPQYDQIDLARLGKGLYGMDYNPGGLIDINNRLTADAQQQSRVANNQQRGADISDVYQYSGNVRELLRSNNSELFGNLDRMDQFSETGPSYDSRLQPMLEQQAEAGLRAGTNLDPAELRQVQQASRAAAEARGLGATNGAMASEILNTYGAGQARLGQRQQFAQGVDQTAYARGMAGDQAQLQKLQAASAGRMATMYDPFQGVLGRQSVNQGTNAGLMGQAQGTVSANSQAGRDQFNPFNSYASQMYSQNSSQELAARTSTASNNAALIGGAMSAAGSAASAM